MLTAPSTIRTIIMIKIWSKIHWKTSVKKLLNSYITANIVTVEITPLAINQNIKSYLNLVIANIAEICVNT